MNQVKAKLLKIVQLERSNSKDDVRPGNTISVLIPELSLFSICFHSLARYIDISSQG